jgi:hypothetical protein
MRSIEVPYAGEEMDGVITMVVGGPESALLLGVFVRLVQLKIKSLKHKL